MLDEEIIAPGCSNVDLPNVRGTEYLDKNGLKYQFNRVKALIVPSLNDTFGQVVLEALQFNCPVVITTRVGAIDYIPSLREFSCDYGNTEQLLLILKRIEYFPMEEIQQEIENNVRELVVPFRID